MFFQQLLETSYTSERLRFPERQLKLEELVHTDVSEFSYVSQATQYRS